MFFLFDVGGTKMRMAGADNGGFVGEPVIMPTPKDFDAGVRLLKEACIALCNGQSPTAVGGGLPGSFDRGHITLVSGSNIASWVGKPVKEILERELAAPVMLENDAALAGLGEAVMGAGKDYEIVGYMTVSTGVGGARITNKIIDRHVFGFEPGFQIVDADHSLCFRGFLPPLRYQRCTKPHLEAHISGRAIEEHYGHRPEEIIDPVIWEDIAHALSLGLTNTILHWSPDVMVLGGSVMQSIAIERVRELVRENLHVYPEVPPIERAQLGDVGGLEGALHIIRTLVH